MAREFEFYTEAGLVKYTGMRADSLRSLLKGLETVSGSSIYYHLHHALFRWHFERGGHMNDFSRWCWAQLRENLLAEKLSSVNPLSYNSIREARDALISHIRNHIGQLESLPRVPHGGEFHFIEMKSFVIPTGHRVSDLESFCTAISEVGINSLFYHLIESRVRMDTRTNDFSLWLREEMNEPELAAQIEQLSPYVYNLYEIRTKLTDLIRRRVDAG